MISMVTFDHDHVDVDGADGRLCESFSLLEQHDDLGRSHRVVRPLSVRKQFPQRHTCIEQVRQTRRHGNNDNSTDQQSKKAVVGYTASMSAHAAFVFLAFNTNRTSDSYVTAKNTN